MPNATENLLAIIIPAYKPDFLGQALACLARQTDQRFNLYICDDASASDIQGIAKTALGSRPHLYKRFESNLGGISIARHWNRCVAETNEPWVWSFSDDDLMDDNCVEGFYKFLETGGESADVLHFSLWMVDEAGKLMAPVTMDKDRETWLEFAYGHLMGWRITSSQNLIFRRSALEKAGGFRDLPRGWWSDIATVIAAGRDRGIRRIPGPRVFWRNNGSSLSSNQSVQAHTDRLRAACLFLQWLNGQLQGPRERLFPDDDGAFQRAMDRFLLHQILCEGSRSSIANWRLLASTRSEVCGGSRAALTKYIAMAAVHDLFSAVGRGLGRNR